MNLRSMFSFSAASSFHPDCLRLRSTSRLSRPLCRSVLSHSPGVSKSLLEETAPVLPLFQKAHQGAFFSSALKSSSSSPSALGSR